MDMPEDTPTKLTNNKENEIEQEQNLQQEENFSSFESNQKHFQHSSNSTDQNGFKNMHVYKQKDLCFPTVPENLGKLFNIYTQNVNRKLELKRSIEKLIQQQVKSLRIAYDKQHFSIQQIIDTDEISKQYEDSHRNYHKRKQQLQKLARKYKELKITHVESMMILDTVMKNILQKYVEKYKQILSIYALEDTVAVLCEEKVKPRRIGKLRLRSQKKVTKKGLSSISNKSEQQNEDGNKSENQTVSQDEQQPKLIQKFILRNFKFYKTQSGVCFQPLQHYIQLPPGRQYKALIIQPSSMNYIAYQHQNLHIIDSSTKQPKTIHTVEVDQPIVYVEILKNFLYLCSADGIVRVYQIKEGRTLVLVKFAICQGKQGQITHFSLTSNPDIVLYAIKGIYLYQLNLATYTTYLLSQLPEQIQIFSPKMITTQNLTYINYYIASTTHGKVCLQQNQRLHSSRKDNSIVKLHKYQNSHYAIYNEGKGVFSITQFVEQAVKK